MEFFAILAVLVCVNWIGYVIIFRKEHRDMATQIREAEELVAFHQNEYATILKELEGL